MPDPAPLTEQQIRDIVKDTYTHVSAETTAQIRRATIAGHVVESLAGPSNLSQIDGGALKLFADKVAAIAKAIDESVVTTFPVPT